MSFRVIAKACTGFVTWLTLASAPTAAQPFSITSRTDSPMGNRPVSVAAVDVNQDGIPDVVTANFRSNDITVRLGTGGGGLGALTRYPVGWSPQSAVALDVNGDLFVDLAVANFSASTISILVGNGTGAFPAPVDYPAGAGTTMARVADFDHDGREDIVTANYNAHSISLLRANGSGGFLPHVQFATGLSPNAVAIGDLDADGHPDVVTANSDGNSVSVLLGNGAGGFAPRVNYTVGTGPADVVVADLDGDGLPDVATANRIANSVTVLRGDGTGALAHRTDMATPSAALSITAGDLNADGRADLAVACAGTNQIAYFLATTTGFGPRVDYTVGVTPQDLQICDMNQDGERDIVVSNYNSSSVSVLIGDVPGGFRVGMPAAALEAYDQSGVLRRLADYHGRWVLLDLCAAWCGPCNMVGEIRQRVEDSWLGHPTVSFTCLTGLIDEQAPGEPSDGQDAFWWAERHRLSGPVLHGSGRGWNSLRAFFEGVGDGAYPTIVILDPAGVIRHVSIGYQEGPALVNLVASLAGVAAPPYAGDPPPPPPPVPVRLPWRPLSQVSATVAYGATTATVTLEPYWSEGTEAMYWADLPGMSATVWVTARVDSLTGKEFLHGTVIQEPLSVVDPWRIRVHGMGWPDGQARVLDGVERGQAWTIDHGADDLQYRETDFAPFVTFDGSTLDFAPLDIGNVPALSPSTLGFMVGTTVRHLHPVSVSAAAVSRSLALAPPIPNPARQRARIAWSLPAPGEVELDVLDTSGRRVRALRSGWAPPGPEDATWDTRDAQGRAVPAGVYFVRLRAGTGTRTTRIAIVR